MMKGGSCKQRFDLKKKGNKEPKMDKKETERLDEFYNATDDNDNINQNTQNPFEDGSF